MLRMVGPGLHQHGPQGRRATGRCVQVGDQPTLGLNRGNQLHRRRPAVRPTAWVGAHRRGAGSGGTAAEHGEPRDQEPPARARRRFVHRLIILTERIRCDGTVSEDEEADMPPAPAGAPGGSGPSATRARQQLLDLLRPVVDDAGYDLEDIAVSSAGRRSLVRVTVDADGGIDLDAVAVVSRVVSDALDAVSFTDGGPLAGAYVLEVSSPGVDRPLTEPRHWRRATGRLVSAEVAGRRVTGRITDVDGEGVTLDCDGTPRRAGWSELGRGRVQVEFNRAEHDDADGDDADDDAGVDAQLQGEE